MFEFIKQMFTPVIMLSSILSSINSLKCILINNQKRKVRPEIVNVNSKEPIFYPYSIRASKCSGSCNNINDPYAKMCVSDAIKSLNVKVFDLNSRISETRHIEWHETCKCECRLDPSVCNKNNARMKINVGVNVKN